MSDPTDIAAWFRLSEKITTSGQPTEDQIRALQTLGVTHVINLGLHTHERALPDEAQSVVAQGMTYIHIPVAFDAPTEEDFDTFCAVMRSVADCTVHVHCIVNARVSAFLFRYQRDVLEIDEAQARKVMDHIWRPGGVWAAFVGDTASVGLSHRAPAERG